MSQTPSRPLLQQAPVQALDEDGFVVALAGTLGFAVAAVVLWFARDALAAAGRGWWWWTAVAGTVIGLGGLWYARGRRRRRLSRTASRPG